MRTILFTAPLFLVLLFFTACSTPTPNIDKSESVRQSLESEASVVIGRVKWLENGKEKKIGSGLFDFSIAPHLIRMEDKSRHLTEVNENGEFIWSLKPGIYLINKINYRDPWSGNYFMVPKVAFRVPEPGKIYHVGTLVVDFAPERDFIGGLSGKVRVKIVDEGYEHYTSAETLLNEPKENIQSSLMIYNKELPRSIDTTAEFNIALQLLNAILFGLSQ